VSNETLGRESACKVVNPWPDKKVQVIRNGKNAETVTGDRFTLKTSVNETLELGAGTFPGAAAETDSLPARGLEEVAHADAPEASTRSVHPNNSVLGLRGE
jgi:hypothetical protein